MRRVDGLKFAAWVVAMAVAVGVVLWLSLPAQGYIDSGVDEPWTNAMNQETYWEARFGGDSLEVECTKYNNHPGGIPAGYEAVVTKGGQLVRVYENVVGAFTVLGPVFDPPGPQTHRHHDISWVMKCNIETTTTTTTEDTTTTTTPSITTSTAPSSTTTILDPTTTTTLTSGTPPTTSPASTTTVPTESTTTTLPVSTTSQQDTTTSLDPPVLVDPPGIDPGDLAPTLPATGLDGLLVPLAFAALGAGVGTLGYARRRWGLKS